MSAVFMLNSGTTTGLIGSVNGLLNTGTRTGRPGAFDGATENTLTVTANELQCSAASHSSSMPAALQCSVDLSDTAAMLKQRHAGTVQHWH